MFRILLVAAAAAATLSLVRHEHELERTRLLSPYAPAQLPAQPGADWLACRADRLDGLPNLSGARAPSRRSGAASTTGCARPCS